MNSNRPKILLIIVFVILTISVGIWLNEIYWCGPNAARVSEQITALGDSLSIKEILLFRSHPGHEINLVSDTVTINDAEELREIQEIVVKSGRRKKNHPIPTWLVNLKIVFSNNEHLIMAVSKISNDSINTMTYFSFPQNTCPTNYTYYSLELGTYLQRKVSFQGRKHK